MLDPCCGGLCFTCRQVLFIASASHGTLYECQTCLEQKQTRAESLSLASTLPLVLCCGSFPLWSTASSFAAITMIIDGFCFFVAPVTSSQHEARGTIISFFYHLLTVSVQPVGNMYHKQCGNSAAKRF